METIGRTIHFLQNEGDIGMAKSTKKERTMGHITAKTHKQTLHHPYTIRQYR